MVVLRAPVVLLSFKGRSCPSRAISYVGSNKKEKVLSRKRATQTWATDLVNCHIAVEGDVPFLGVVGVLVKRSCKIASLTHR